ncbi:MAG: hypothetical protein RLZZ387_314 [Chloroflexota bacterium]
MRREDYILRLIAEFVRALHRITGLAREGRHIEALESLDHAARQLAGGGLDDLLRLPSAELLARLTFGEQTEVARDRCAFAAELLREAGASYSALGEEDTADASFLAALRLQLTVLERYGVEDMPEFAPDITDIVAAVGLYRLPLDLYHWLVAHYERTGAYADAEDALHALLDAVPGDTSALQRGLALYHRLLARTDEELLAGDLSRAEVEEALAELRARYET